MNILVHGKFPIRAKSGSLNLTIPNDWNITINLLLQGILSKKVGRKLEISCQFVPSYTFRMNFVVHTIVAFSLPCESWLVYFQVAQAKCEIMRFYDSFAIFNVRVFCHFIVFCLFTCFCLSTFVLFYFGTLRSSWSMP